MAELLRVTEHITGTAPLVGAASEALSFAEKTSGTHTIAGYASERMSFTEKTSGVVVLSGISRESIGFSERSAGYVVVTGKSRETMAGFSEKSVAALWGRDSGTISFTERITGTAPVRGTDAATVSFSEHVYGSVVEQVAGVWCINLATGGHSRYEGALDGSARVNAYAVLPSNQLGSDRAKYVPDIYVHMRTDGDVEITTLTDEQIERSGYIISDDGRPGLHRRRRKLAGGIKCTNWGFKLSNVDGSNFTIKSAEPVPLATKRVQ